MPKSLCFKLQVPGKKSMQTRTVIGPREEGKQVSPHARNRTGCVRDVFPPFWPEFRRIVAPSLRVHVDDQNGEANDLSLGYPTCGDLRTISYLSGPEHTIEYHVIFQSCQCTAWTEEGRRLASPFGRRRSPANKRARPPGLH
jgi:hypothetical protein